MSLEDLGIEGYVSRTLLIDGDIIIYKPCCIYNEDDDHERRMIMKAVNNAIEKMMKAADCDRYIMFVTTKFNFRDQLVDDYKANRDDVERPVNLAWAKRECMRTLNNHYHKGLEADDLLGIHMTEDTVLWSLDKDLRQIPGYHLDDATMKVVTITEAGTLRETVHVTESGKKKKKVYFDGLIGFYYQLLIGDDTDYILGCAKRVDTVWKSGAKKGIHYLKRTGVGSGAAIKILTGAAYNPGNDTVLQASLKAVAKQYWLIFGDKWKEVLETQANLLFMVREQKGEIIKRWTYDGRDEYFDLIKGVILNDSTDQVSD